MGLLRAAMAAVAVAVLFSLEGAHADASVCRKYHNNNLIRKCGPNYFDLEKLKGRDGKSLLTTMHTARGYIYYLDFENGGTPRKLPNCTLDDNSNLGVEVRMDGGGCYFLGKTNLVNWDYDNSMNQLTITAVGGEHGRSMSIQTQCAFGAKYATLRETGDTGLTYNFQLNLPGDRCTTTPPSPQHRQCTIESDYGCFKDTEVPRTLPQKADNAGSYEECAHNCYSLGFTGTAGMESGEECWCSNEDGTVGDSAPSTDCSKPCPDDKSKMCGGLARLNEFSFTCHSGQTFYSCSGGRCVEDPQGPWSDPNCNGACTSPPSPPSPPAPVVPCTCPPDVPVGVVLGIVLGMCALFIAILVVMYLYFRQQRAHGYMPVPTASSSSAKHNTNGAGQAQSMQLTHHARPPAPSGLPSAPMPSNLQHTPGGSAWGEPPRYTAASAPAMEPAARRPPAFVGSAQATNHWGAGQKLPAKESFA